MSPGFLDLRCHFGEPGFENAESLDTGSDAALAGGYTKVCMLPNTKPVLDSMESTRDLNIGSTGKDLITDSRIGPNCLHGAHQSAQKSTTIGISFDASITSFANDAVSVSDTTS